MLSHAETPIPTFHPDDPESSQKASTLLPDTVFKGCKYKKGYYRCRSDDDRKKFRAVSSMGKDGKAEAEEGSIKSGEKDGDEANPRSLKPSLVSFALLLLL
eukprot:1054030-Amorphochlora_amoeboformis.AAC.1